MSRIARLILSTLVVLCLATAAPAQTMLNLNSATEQELAAVPVIGAELAKVIVDYRSDMGDLKSMDELLEVDGMTPEKLEEIKKAVGLEAIEGNECSC